MMARFSDFQAAMGLRALETLASGNRRRTELGLMLLELLRARGVPGLLEITGDPGECTFWRFPLWVHPARVTELRRHLLSRGVDSSPTNLACCSREPMFTDFRADTPHARRFVDEMIFLPIHPNLRDGDMRHVADAVSHYYEAQ